MTDERRRDYELRASIMLLIESVRYAADVPRTAIAQRLDRCRSEINELADVAAIKCERIARGENA